MPDQDKVQRRNARKLMSWVEVKTMARFAWRALSGIITLYYARSRPVSIRYPCVLVLSLLVACPRISNKKKQKNLAHCRKCGLRECQPSSISLLKNLGIQALYSILAWSWSPAWVIHGYFYRLLLGVIKRPTALPNVVHKPITTAIWWLSIGTEFIHTVSCIPHRIL